MARFPQVVFPLVLVLAACSGSDGPESGAPVPAITTSLITTTTTTPTTTTTTIPATTTTTITYPRREIAVTVEPAAAVLTVSDAGGAVSDAPGPFSGLVSGPVELAVAADGYETETASLGADRTSYAFWLDPAGQVLDKALEFGSGNAPKQVAFRPGHEELWVTLLGGSGFEVYDPGSGSRIAAVDLPRAGSVEVIFNRSGSLAYISQMETASVYEIDADSKQVLRVMPTTGVWTKVMVLSPDEQTLWASNWVSNDVSEFDLSTGEVRRKLGTVTTPRGLYVTPDAAKLYVAGFASGEIQVFDLATGSSTILYRSGGAMRHLVGSPDGSLLYASDMARDQILIVDTATDAVTELATVDRLPNTIDVSPDGRVLYVSNRGRNNPQTYYIPGPEWGTVAILDTATGVYLDAIVGGNQTTGLDVSPDGAWLAYSDFLDDRVVVYRIPPFEELAAGEGGRWVAHLAGKVK
ncbi:MAG: YncE family protein [Acidimicrobiia bacterium]|nr:YncE family protein [Acidimicrobiia bacterium]